MDKEELNLISGVSPCPGPIKESWQRPLEGEEEGIHGKMGYPGCRGMTGGPLSLVEPLICAKVCARPGDPETIRHGHSPKGGYRLYELK